MTATHKAGEVVIVRGVAYLVVEVDDDGEPTLRRL